VAAVGLVKRARISRKHRGQSADSSVSGIANGGVSSIPCMGFVRKELMDGASPVATECAVVLALAELAMLSLVDWDGAAVEQTDWSSPSKSLSLPAALAAAVPVVTAMLSRPDPGRRTTGRFRVGTFTRKSNVWPRRIRLEDTTTPCSVIILSSK